MTRGIGTPDYVDELLGEYHAWMPNDLLHNETDSLLAAVLMELQAQRAAEGNNEEVSVILEQRRRELAGADGQQQGVYHAQSYDLTTEWTKVDLGFTASEFDLRNISGPVVVAFAEPDGAAEKRIEYDDTDSPIAGISVRTEKVWLKAESGSESLNMEAWV